MYDITVSSRLVTRDFSVLLVLISVDFSVEYWGHAHTVGGCQNPEGLLYIVCDQRAVGLVFDWTALSKGAFVIRLQETLIARACETTHS